MTLSLPVHNARAESFVLDRIVAVINKEAITWGELYSAMERDFGKRMQDMDEKTRMKYFKAKESLYLENIINVRLQLQEAKKLGITVKDSEAEAAMENIRQKNNLSPIQFSKELAMSGYTDESYKKTVSEQIAITRLIDREVRRKVRVTPQDVQDFLDRNRLPGDGVFYRIRQVYFRPPQPSEVEVLKSKITNFMNEYNKGQDFGELAARYSENATAENGGDMGYLHESKLSEEIKKVISTMKPGEVSRPLQSALGVHILRLEDVRTATNMVEEERFDAEYHSWLRNLREGSLVENRL